MTASTFNHQILVPVLPQVLSLIGLPPSLEATRLLLAIAGQESNWTYRFQLAGKGKKGPARGFWQFEKIGVKGVLTHRATKTQARILCRGCGLDTDDAVSVWEALETNDVLAAGMARLLLETNPGPLPVSEVPAWLCYLRLWRPGKPNRGRWGQCWQDASAAVAGIA